MNDTSPGLLSVRWGLAAALFGGLAASLAGCPGPAPMAGAGGSGGGSSTSDSSSSSSTSASSSSTSSTTSSTSSSTGGMPCATPSNCPSPKTCQVVGCVEGMCTFDAATAGTPCSDNGGKVCDAAGQCVTCLSDVDCPAPSTKCQVAVCTASGECDVQPVTTSDVACSDNGGKVCDDTGHCVPCNVPDDCLDPAAPPCAGSVYTAPACVNHKCVDGPMTNCALSNQACKLKGCGPCNAASDCALPALGSCAVPTCDLGVCGFAVAQPGTMCMTPSNVPGLCSDNGGCLASKLVFVTSVPMGSALGGTLGADTKCQKIADMKSLGGTWLSWTSDGLTPPAKTRLAHHTGPYLLLNGTLVATNWMTLTSGTLAHPINIDESGMPVAQGSLVWTGTNPDGSYGNSSCGDWTGAGTGGVAGMVGQTGTAWTNAGSKSCDPNTMGHIYCFQQ